MLMLRMSSRSMLGLRIFACLEKRLSRFARQSGTLVQIRIRLRLFCLSTFSFVLFRHVLIRRLCLFLVSFVRFILSRTIFDSPRALCSYSSRLDASLNINGNPENSSDLERAPGARSIVAHIFSYGTQYLSSHEGTNLAVFHRSATHFGSATH